MWFSYPGEEAWVPLPLTRVKEIQQMNRTGTIPADLGEVIEIETKPVKILDYENVVGQDSLTRLDERNRNKKKNKSRNKNNKPNGFAGNDGQRQGSNSSQGTQVANPQGNRPPNAGSNNNNRNRPPRPNGNNPNRPNPNNNPDRNRDNQQDNPQ
ncbi:MAG: hypothetical protein JWQ57_1239, partial [Mucilaginibacter sp.]|nr:hypothetical protein [Mucilaginibacter sp.]